MTWLPKVAEFPLDIPASDPLKFHVDLFGGLGDNFIIYKTVCCFCPFGWLFVVADGLVLQKN